MFRCAQQDNTMLSSRRRRDLPKHTTPLHSFNTKHNSSRCFAALNRTIECCHPDELQLIAVIPTKEGSPQTYNTTTFLQHQSPIPADVSLRSTGQYNAVIPTKEGSPQTYNTTAFLQHQRPIPADVSPCSIGQYQSLYSIQKTNPYPYLVAWFAVDCCLE